MSELIGYLIYGLGVLSLLILIALIYWGMIIYLIKVIKKIKRIDYAWVLFLSCQYRKSERGKNKAVYDLIRTASIRMDYANSEEEFTQTLETLERIEKKAGVYRKKIYKWAKESDYE